MGIFSKFRRSDKSNRASLAAVEERDSIKQVESQLMQSLIGQLNTRAGVAVNPISAMGVPTVFACVRRISNTISTLPLHLMRDNGGFAEKADANPLYDLLHRAPNNEMTIVDFLDCLQSQATLRSHAYAVINFDGVGRPADIRPVDDPRRVQAKRDPNGDLYYTIDGQRFEQREIIHLRNNTRDGVCGQDLVTMQSGAIGLAIALTNNASDFFANGSRPSGAFKHPESLGDKAYARLKKSTENKYEGSGNAYKTMLLEEGMDWVQFRHTNQDSQMIEARKQQDYDIARMFGVPPHKVGILDKSSFNNIEEQSREYVQDTILPWVIRWEHELTRKLLPAVQIAQGFHFKFNLDGLLRSNLKNRYDAYLIGIQNGIINKDEARAKEGLPPIPDGKGQIFIEPMNHQPVGQSSQPATTDDNE